MLASMEAIPAAALEELAVFPLPNLVFFPHTLLPLHIFEPRYRAMIADVLAGSRVLAVARLRPGYEADYEGRPPIFEVAGVGACVHADRLPDGRYHIMLHGLARVFLEEELPPGRAYRVARARVLGDGSAARSAELEAQQQALVALCDRLAAALPDADGLRQLARAVDSPGGCADAVASAVVRDPDARQTLLELLDPADRLDRVTAHLTQLLHQLGGAERLN
jgi:Lon protease-like protein